MIVFVFDEYFMFTDIILAIVIRLWIILLQPTWLDIQLQWGQLHFITYKYNESNTIIIFYSSDSADFCSTCISIVLLC